MVHGPRPSLPSSIRSDFRDGEYSSTPLLSAVSVKLWNYGCKLLLLQVLQRSAANAQRVSS